jgi:hypothetical protein
MRLINSAPSHEDVWGSGVIVPPFFNSALNGGKWLNLRQGIEPAEPIGREARWAPEPVWTPWRREIFLSLPGTEPGRPARSIFET